jgi:Dynein heavy chain region D6 P-loop domain
MTFGSDREVLPDPWNTELDVFQKVLVLRCLRPDKVTNAMQNFVAHILGQRFIEPQTAELGTVFRDSSPTTPLIFVLSTGTDPAASLYKFAEEMKFSKKLSVISLGQGQVRASSLRVVLQQSYVWFLVFSYLLFGSQRWKRKTQRFYQQSFRILDEARN